MAFWVSQPLLPDQTAEVSAGNISANTTVEIARAPDCANSSPLDSRVNALTWSAQSTWNASNSNLAFTIPADWNAGLFAYRLTENGVTSNTFYINKPDVWFIQGDRGDTSSPGGWLQVHGTALALPGAQPSLALVLNGGVMVTLHPDPNDAFNNGYRQRFAVPANVPESWYEAYYHNGYGGVQGWSKYANTQGSDGSTGGGVDHVGVRPIAAWPSTEFKVADQGGPNWDAKVASAFDKARANGGGVVRFPAGEVPLTNHLVVPLHTVIAGAGKDVSILRYDNVPVDQAGIGPDEYALVIGTPDNFYRRGAFSVEDLTIRSGVDAGSCIRRDRTVEPSHVRRVACRYPNLATSPITGNVPISGIGIMMTQTNVDFEVSDSTFDVRTGIYVKAQTEIMAFNRFSNNTIRWRDNEAQFNWLTHNLIYEGNHVTYAGTYNGNGYGGVNNPNPGFWFAAFGGSNARDLYYGSNITDREDPTPLQGNTGLTFDGSEGSYFGLVSSVNTTDGRWMQLAGNYDNSHGQLVPGAFVGILAGRGAGQWRTLISRVDGVGSVVAVDRDWDIVPDGSSYVTLNRFLGRTLFVNNDFAGKPLLQTFFASHDVIFANNKIGSPGRVTNMAVWVGDQGGTFTSEVPGWHYQVLDNTITNSGVAATVVQTFSGSRGYLFPLTQGHIFRNNRPDNLYVAMIDIQPATLNTGFIVEGNLGMRSVKVFDGTLPFVGLVRNNKTPIINMGNVLSDFTGISSEYENFLGAAGVTLTPMPTRWTYCANEGGTCNFTGPKLVRFGMGAIRRYAMFPYINGVPCVRGAFLGGGDAVRYTYLGALTCEYGDP